MWALRYYDTEQCSLFPLPPPHPCSCVFAVYTLLVTCPTRFLAALSPGPSLQLCEAVRSRAAVDVAPPPGPAALFMRDEMSLEGYKHLLAVGEYCTAWEGCRTVLPVPCRCRTVPKTHSYRPRPVNCCLVRASILGGSNILRRKSGSPVDRP